MSGLVRFASPSLGLLNCMFFGFVLVSHTIFSSAGEAVESFLSWLRPVWFRPSNLRTARCAIHYLQKIVLAFLKQNCDETNVHV